MKERILPASLEHGDTIGIVAPAGQLLSKQLFYDGLRIIREMGFEVKFPRELWPGGGYVADSDERRADELHTLFADTEVKAIIAARGGFGSLRILPRLDIIKICSNAKFLVGFSDITVLQNYLFQSGNLISLQGPTICSLATADASSHERLYRSLTGGWAKSIELSNLEIIQDGPVVEGELVGGNLASLVSMLGTPFDCSWDGRIVFLEDTNEPLYKIDRMITQLELAGKFSNVKAIILGDFSFTGHDDRILQLRYLEAIWTRFLDVIKGREIPVWANFTSGHCPVNFTFPVGATVQLDNKKRSVHFR
jgi:muramoyltetrapeptide carboxypeptidase